MFDCVGHQLVGKLHRNGHVDSARLQFDTFEDIGSVVLENVLNSSGNCRINDIVDLTWIYLCMRGRLIS
jgi:hypothetical protein